MLDKSNYPNKQSIGERVRKAADDYFNKSAKGKGTPGVRVKRVFRKKEVKKK